MKNFIIYIDGGSRGNPGPAAIGVVFCNEKDQPIKKYSQFLGQASNNEAEYQALIFGLKKFKALFGKETGQQASIEVRSDSELLVKQLNAQYKVLDPKIQVLFLRAWNLKLDFKKIKLQLIDRQRNKMADQLVNLALDKESRMKALAL